MVTNRRPHRPWRLRIRGQSLLEFALMLPILLIIISGIFEFGFMFNTYLALLDAARNAARFASDNQMSEDTIADCTATRDFFRQTSCVALFELSMESPSIDLCTSASTPREHCSGTDWMEYDDIIISVYSITKEGHPSTQFPEVRRFPNPGIAICDDYGWSYLSDMLGGHGPHSSQCANRGTNPHDVNEHTSQFKKDDILPMIDVTAPNMAYVMVEITFHYWQVLALPWFTQFVPDPIIFRPYAVWPVPAMEPTSTG